jgi:hypothetical protein
MEEILKFRVNPETNHGWNFKYEFLQEIERRVSENRDEQMQLEQVDAMLMELIDYFSVNNL